VQGSLHTAANIQVPHNEGDFCNKFGTAPQDQTVGNDKGKGDLRGIQNGVLVVQCKALSLNQLGETGENEGVFNVGQYCCNVEQRWRSLGCLQRYSA
jgi:hypothetical protein